MPDNGTDEGTVVSQCDADVVTPENDGEGKEVCTNTFNGGRKKKNNRNKILDRLTYSPKKHKQKFNRGLRKALQTRGNHGKKGGNGKLPSVHLKFGSFNIDGIDIETSSAIDKLIQEHNFDVSVF